MISREMTKSPLDPINQMEAASEVVRDAATQDSSLWVLTADVMRSTKTKAFSEQFPGRFINVGIAEQSMVGIAAGLATCGKLPIVNAFAAMLSMRACEQIRTDIAYPNLNVKIIGYSAGMSFGHSGPTHHSIEDIAILRAMPNMTVIVPSDAQETREAVRAALAWRGPIYIRIGRVSERTVYSGSVEFKVGQAIVLREGADATLIGCGRTVADCILAADVLLREGIKARVVDMHTIKPIDLTAIRNAAEQTALIVTAEEHNILGGLGGAVAEVLADLGSVAPLRRVGIPDTYPVVGSQEALLEEYGITASHIVDVVLKNLRASPRRRD